MSATLTPEELSEIAAFARAYPEAVPQMMGSKNPRILLERVRLTLKEVNDAIIQQAVPVESVKKVRESQGGIVPKLRIYPIGERYQAFRGRGSNSNTWYVYDVQENRYVGGSFPTLSAAMVWADAQ